MLGDLLGEGVHRGDADVAGVPQHVHRARAARGVVEALLHAQAQRNQERHRRGNLTQGV